MIEHRKDKTYVVNDDIAIINDALRRGYDVAIKRTDCGVKIIQEQAKVLKRTEAKLGGYGKRN